MEANFEKSLETMQSVYARNEALAQALNDELTKDRVYTVNIMGSPGAGKTSVLIGLIKALAAPALVIEGDIESDIDSQKLRKMGISSYQINTGGACHLDAPLIRSVVSGRHWRDCFLFIENIGNLVCPAEFLIGEHIKMLVSSVTEGSDKPYKYPLAFEKADIIILNKTDLLPNVQFDSAFYMKGVRALNRRAPIYQLSALEEKGFGELAEWITQKKKRLFAES